MKVNEGASGPIQEQVAQPGSGEKVNEEELNLFIVAENVQQSGNVAANEDQEILQIEVTEPKSLISNSLDLKHTKKTPWEQPTFVPVYIQTFSGYRRLKVF